MAVSIPGKALKLRIPEGKWENYTVLDGENNKERAKECEHCLRYKKKKTKITNLTKQTEPISEAWTMFLEEKKNETTIARQLTNMQTP